MLPQRVSQDHGSGCFVACVAMLLGVSYLEAFKLVHPDRIIDENNYDMAGIKSLDPVQDAFDILKRLNLNPKFANVQQMRHLRRMAIVVIRWKYYPDLLHGIIFNPFDKRILDPAYENPMKMKRYADQMDSAIYVERKTA